MPLPRILVILGSGQTSSTRVTPHQRVFSARGSDVSAAFLDTRYGLQQNADELGDEAPVRAGVARLAAFVAEARLIELACSPQLST